MNNFEVEVKLETDGVTFVCFRPVRIVEGLKANENLISSFKNLKYSDQRRVELRNQVALVHYGSRALKTLQTFYRWIMKSE